MKVIGINGSARKGGNTDLMIRTVFRDFFLNHEMFVCGSTYWNMGYGQLPGDVLNDAEAMANMCNLGHNMAFLLKAVCREAI